MYKEFKIYTFQIISSYFQIASHPDNNGKLIKIAKGSIIKEFKVMYFREVNSNLNFFLFHSL